MINIRKGNAHSLQQTDFIGTIKSGEDIVAGMLVRKNSSGEMVKVTTLTTAEDSGVVGFAVTTQSEGDAIESGKIGALALDGGSVIETDQVTTSLSGLTAADIGKAVVADGSTAGKVKVVAHGGVSTSRVIGVVYDVPRYIYVGFTGTLVLPIKLGSEVATLT